MSGMDGGRVAARGFQFQYVRTLEALLTSALQAEVYACRIEGPHEPSSETMIDVVDFDLVSEAGECLLAAQVKSAATGRVISGPKAFSILVDLTSSFEARRYELITAATPDANCRRLAQTLIDHGPNTSALRNALAKILKNAPKALASLNRLDNEHLTRLSRARIVFDIREDQEIREQLHYLLREYRSRNRTGLGDRSAGLIFGYLVAEIMRRAASPETAQWTIEDFSSEVLIDDEILTRALGRQDWGVVYGPIAPVPHVPRPDILKKVSDVFLTSSLDKTGPRLCAITGLSGIGKSSMAASYIAEWADHYDLVFWADAATPETLTTSFRRLHRHLIERKVETAGATVEYMREQLFELLRGFPGKWLLIFDDAFQGVASGWLPRLGDGDILITSIDSAGWRHAHGRIEMARMSQSQAVQLFKCGLSIEHSTTKAEERSIVHLVESLEGWPLAIELACGYLASCGIQLDQLSMYQSMLIARAMDDQVSIPWGYPRTLVASILLNIDRLKQISHSGGPPFEQVSTLLCGLCYFASSRIPLHLALVSVYVDPVEVPDRSALLTLMDESEAPVRELIRTLTQVSFVRYTEPLPPFDGESTPGADDTISLNSVLQEILRKVFERSFSTTELLSRCAFHANLWLRHAIEANSGERAWEIAQHAASLIGNVEKLGTQDNVTALLLGNLAGFYEAHGQHRFASELLVRELAWLDGMDDPNELLIFQSRIILAEICVREQDSTDGAEYVVSRLSGLDTYIKKVALESESAAAFLVTRAAIVLETQSRISPSHSELNSLRRKISDLAGLISATPVTEMLGEFADLSQLITEDKYGEAERLARTFLDNHSEPNAIPTVATLEVRRLLIESLAYQRKWSDAIAEF